MWFLGDPLAFGTLQVTSLDVLRIRRTVSEQIEKPEHLIQGRHMSWAQSSCASSSFAVSAVLDDRQIYPLGVDQKWRV